jgi:molecular chaperone HscB
MFKEELNPFETLGLEPTFEMDEKALDEAYFARQKITHPDRFVYHSQPERDAAALQSSRLNQAYEIIKNIPSRAKALLKLRGIEVGDEDGKSIQDPEVLEEIMNFQEALTTAISPLDQNLIENQIQDILKEVKSSFGVAFQTNQHHNISALYVRITYLSKLLEDLKIRRRQSSLKVL